MKRLGEGMTDAELRRLRAEFLRLLTQDSETRDRRRRDYNQAIFNAEKGWAVWSSTDLDMVMEKFDRAVHAALEGAGDAA